MKKRYTILSTAEDIEAWMKQQGLVWVRPKWAADNMPVWVMGSPAEHTSPETCEGQDEP